MKPRTLKISVTKPKAKNDTRQISQIKISSLLSTSYETSTARKDTVTKQDFDNDSKTVTKRSSIDKTFRGDNLLGVYKDAQKQFSITDIDN